MGRLGFGAGTAVVANPQTNPAAFATNAAEAPGFPTPYDLVSPFPSVFVGPGQQIGPQGQATITTSAASLLLIGAMALVAFVMLK